MIRPANARDHDWIAELAAEVYRELGEYGSIMRSWLGYPGVVANIWDEGEPRGFTLVGFYRPGDDPSLYVADLLAIAVSPPYQRQGIGRQLLVHAIDIARLPGPEGSASEMRLSVAEHNRVGQKLFAAHGFVLLPDDFGTYDGGQRALRMVLRL